MAQDATGTPTALGIPKFNTDVDPPSGLGTNAMMDAIDALITGRIVKPSGIIAGEAAIWNGSSWDRSSVTKLSLSSVNISGTPTGSKFLRDDGSWQTVSTGLPAGVLLGVQVFTATGTYTPTSGTNRIYVEMVGAGGGGGGATTTGAGISACGSGGGGGAYAAKFITSSFSGVTVTVGAGGAGGVGGGAAGTGGTTSFGSLCIAVGGIGGGNVGGAGGEAYQIAGAIGGSAASCTGDIKLSGGGGYAGLADANSWTHGGGGGSAAGAVGGGGGVGQSTAVGGFNGDSAQQGGGGGGAAGNHTSQGSSRTGGAGGAGIVRIWEFE